MDDELSVKIEVPAEIILLRPLDHFVRILLGQLPAFSGREQLINNIELAFDEAFTNIQRHAYRSQHKGPVTIEIKVGPHSLEFRFEDQGQSFDPSSVQPPDLDQPAEGGLGIWLMRQVMDEFHYHSEADGKNVLRLIKRFPQHDGDSA
ncbi:MAG: ATP-binding protein [Desulfomonilaceae bacterium]|nr:ATP-binding protein [Desulfomonilaceae bacterium]